MRRLEEVGIAIMRREERLDSRSKLRIGATGRSQECRSLGRRTFDGVGENLADGLPTLGADRARLDVALSR
jgi:hypothetical protein